MNDNTFPRNWKNPTKESEDSKNGSEVMNEYFEQFMSEFGEEYPDTFSSNFDSENYRRRFMLRDELIMKYAFAIPTDEVIQKLVEMSPIIEIGAGTGYWAKLITEAGGDVIAVDNGERDDWTGKWFEVRDGTYEEVSNHPDRTLFLCWPPYESDMAFETLKLYKGKTVVYVGEGHGGCCATDEFFDYLEENFVEQKGITIPRWPGIHDYMEIWTRK